MRSRWPLLLVLGLLVILATVGAILRLGRGLPEPRKGRLAGIGRTIQRPMRQVEPLDTGKRKEIS